MTGLDKRTPTPEDVWDHGYRAGLRDASRGTPGASPNPYRAEKTTDHPCGDYPAPCNCDDPDTHDGATTATIEDAARDINEVLGGDMDNHARIAAHRLADAGLLATARTHPGREQIIEAIGHDSEWCRPERGPGRCCDAPKIADAVLALLADRPGPGAFLGIGGG